MKCLLKYVSVVFACEYAHTQNFAIISTWCAVLTFSASLALADLIFSCPPRDTWGQPSLLLFIACRETRPASPSLSKVKSALSYGFHSLIRLHNMVLD